MLEPLSTQAAPAARVESHVEETWSKRALGFAPLAGALGGVLLVVVGLVQQSGLAALGRLFANPIMVLVLLETLHLAFCTWRWLGYRPVPLPGDDALPVLSVIIPAYNEGPMVERSIRSVAESDYPKSKLEIVVVDDGSRDDTYFHMEHLRRAYPELVRIIRFRGNQGKRAALRAGFEGARGEVVITIDSDSEIEPTTLRAMAAPFQRAEVGSVAGWVRVLNRDNWLGRMLDVQFMLSFDFLRAAQSTFGAVFVCPGALSAFRRSVIVPAMDEWVNQKFLGRPVGHGEDQALTNIVLKSGFETVYQRNAVVWTLVPDRYRQLSRMLTRWDRSYIVEGFSFARFMFTRYRRGNRLLPILGFVASTFRLIYVFFGLVALPGLLFRQPGALVSGLLAGAAMASVSSLYYLRVSGGFRFIWGAAYALFSFLTLQWVLPYALITIRDERWGTR